jgi:hypothetical protein
MGLSIVLWHLMAHTYTRLSLHDLVNLNLSMFCEVFLKLRKFCQLYDNFGANQTITFGWYNFSVKSGNPGSQWFLLFFITWRPSRHCHSVTRSDYNYKMFFYGWTALVGRGLPLLRFRDHTQWHTHSVGLFWTSDRPVAEPSTWEHTTLTRNRHPCPRLDSNPQSHQASGRRPTP